MIFRFRAAAALAAALLFAAPALAGPDYSPAKKGQYPSPNFNAPDADRITLRGEGSTGPVGGMTVRAKGATTPRPLDERAADVAHLLDYGPGGATVDATGAADMTAAWTAALATGRKVVVPNGTFAACGVVIPSNAVIEGMGMLTSRVKATPGCNKDVFVGDRAYELFDTNKNDGPGFVRIQNLTIDGNASQQTAVGSARDRVNGIAFYGASWRLNHVLITNVLGHGIRSQWYQYGEQVGGMEARFNDVTVDTVGRHGWWNGGPHDLVSNNMMIIDASQEADNTWSGMKADYFSGGKHNNIHVWHRSTATNRVKWCVDVASGNVFEASDFEGCRGWANIAGDSNSFAHSAFYAYTGAAGSTGIVVAGNGNRFTANQYSGAGNGTPMRLIQLGLPGKDAFETILRGGFANGFANGIVNFVNDSGYNVIDLIGYDNGNTSATGTPNGSTSLSYRDNNGSLVSGFGVGSVNKDPDKNNYISGCRFCTVGGGLNFIGSGENNFVNAYWATIPGGKGNTLYGDFSVAPGGQNAHDRGRINLELFGAVGWGSGTAQTTKAVLHGAGSGTGAIRLTADGGAAAPRNCLAIPDATSYGLRILVTVRSTATDAGSLASTFTWSMPVATLYRAFGAGTTAMALGTAATVATGSFAPTVSATADTANGCLNLTVTPPSGNAATLHAVARVESVEAQ